jgi:hypothetical protein
VTSEPWRIQAEEQFPDLKAKLSESDSPGMFWIELTFEFQNAYDTNRTERVAQIYRYARWCCEQPPGTTAANDLATIVASCFFEHIPTHALALADMPRWWTLEEVRGMKEIFSYMDGEAGYARVLAQYGAK